jgi:hypothetical protein
MGRLPYYSLLYDRAAISVKPPEDHRLTHPVVQPVLGISELRSWVSPRCPSRSARHTVSDVIGKVMSRTPRCHSASITALPIAAGAPMAPLSLAPLTPSGLLGAGVAMNVVWNAGRSDARGMP